MLGDPHFSFRRSLPFLIFSILLKIMIQILIFHFFVWLKMKRMEGARKLIFSLVSIFNIGWKHKRRKPHGPGVHLFATLSYRGVGDDKQYNQDEVDAIGSLCHVHSKQGRVHFML